MAKTEKIPHIKVVNIKGFHPLDKKKLINHINKNIDIINNLIFDETEMQLNMIISDNGGYYSRSSFEQTLNEISPGIGYLMLGLYADWYKTEFKNITAKVTSSVNIKIFSEIQNIIGNSRRLSSIGHINESFDKWLKSKFIDGNGKYYKGVIKDTLKFEMAYQWEKLISAAKKSVTARGYVRNARKIPLKILNPLKEHIKNVFRDSDYSSVKKINSYIDDFKKALPNYKTAKVDEETYKFFNSVTDRNDLSAEYKEAKDFGKDVTNTTYLLIRYASLFSDEANTIYEQLVQKANNMILIEKISKDAKLTITQLLPILYKLGQHIKNVFRDSDYNSVKKINGCIDDLKKALLNYKTAKVNEETYKFFNSVRDMNDISKEYKEAKDFGKDVTNTTYLLIKYASLFSNNTNTIYKQLEEKAEKMIFAEIKKYLGGNNSKFKEYIKKFTNNRISDNVDVKNKDKLNPEDYKQNAYRAPFVNAFINLSEIIVNGKGSLTSQNKKDLLDFLQKKYKNFICLEAPVTNFNKMDEETKKIVMSFINIFCNVL